MAILEKKIEEADTIARDLATLMYSRCLKAKKRFE
jgi:hypothetical protein